MSYQKNNIINSYLQEELGFNIVAPKEMKLNNEGDNFWWFSQLEMKKTKTEHMKFKRELLFIRIPIIVNPNFLLIIIKKKRFYWPTFFKRQRK